MEASTSTLPPFKLKPLTVAQEDQIIESRLSNDERGIRKTLKNILTLERRSSQSTVEKDVDMDGSSESTAAKSKGTLSVEDKNAEAYSVFNTELKSLELHVKKAGIVGKMEAKMRETYAAKGKEIERKQPQHTQDIASLREKFRNAEEERKQKMEYNDAAQKILAIGKRDDLEAAIQERQEALESLKAQKNAVLRSLRMRSVALGKVLQDLTQVEEVPPENTSTEGNEMDTEALEAEKMLVEDAPKEDGSNDGEDQEEDDDDDETGKRRKLERPPSPTMDDIQMVEDVLPSEEFVEEGNPSPASEPSDVALDALSPTSSALSNSPVSSPSAPPNADLPSSASSPSASPNDLEEDLDGSEKTGTVPVSPSHSNISVTSTSSSTIIMASNFQAKPTRSSAPKNSLSLKTASGSKIQLERSEPDSPSIDQLADGESNILDDSEDPESKSIQPAQEESQLLTSSGRPKRRSLATSTDVSLSSAPQTKKSKTRR